MSLTEAGHDPGGHPRMVLEDGRTTGYAKLERAVLEGENLLKELPVSVNTESERKGGNGEVVNYA